MQQVLNICAKPQISVNLLALKLILMHLNPYILKFLLLVAAALLLFQFQSVTIFAQSKRSKPAEKLSLFKQFVNERMKRDKIPGLTIGFIRNGETWVKGFGFADLENKIPAQTNSAYRLASVTKTNDRSGNSSTR